MWQTKYASAVPKDLGLGFDFRPCSEGNFLNGRPQSVVCSRSYAPRYLNSNPNSFYLILPARKYCGNNLHFQTILVFSEQLFLVESAFYPKEKKGKAYYVSVAEYKSMPENVLECQEFSHSVDQSGCTYKGFNERFCLF